MFRQQQYRQISKNFIILSVFIFALSIYTSINASKTDSVFVLEDCWIYPEKYGVNVLVEEIKEKIIHIIKSGAEPNEIQKYLDRIKFPFIDEIEGIKVWFHKQKVKVDLRIINKVSFTLSY